MKKILHLSPQKICLKFKNFSSEKTLLSTLVALKHTHQCNPIKTLLIALKRLRPGLKLLPRIKAGKVIYLPAHLTENNAYHYAVDWIYKATLDGSSRVVLATKLATEISNTLQKRGLAFKSKIDLMKALTTFRVNLKAPRKKRVFKPYFFFNNLLRKKSLKIMRKKRKISSKQKKKASKTTIKQEKHQEIKPSKPSFLRNLDRLIKLKKEEIKKNKIK